MGAQVQEMERDTFEPPVINSWRQRPTREQVRFAIDLCRSELPYAERTATVATFTVMDSREMSELIDRLKGLRQARLRRLRRTRRGR
jgi:hypothetical protein